MPEVNTKSYHICNITKDFSILRSESLRSCKESQHENQNKIDVSGAVYSTKNIHISSHDVQRFCLEYFESDFPSADFESVFGFSSYHALVSKEGITIRGGDRHVIGSISKISLSNEECLALESMLNVWLDIHEDYICTIPIGVPMAGHLQSEVYLPQSDTCSRKIYFRREYYQSLKSDGKLKKCDGWFEEPRFKFVTTKSAKNKKRLLFWQEQVLGYDWHLDSVTRLLRCLHSEELIFTGLHAGLSRRYLNLSKGSPPPKDRFDDTDYFYVPLGSDGVKLLKEVIGIWNNRFQNLNTK